MSIWDILFLSGVIATFAGFSSVLAYVSWGAASEPLRATVARREQPLARRDFTI
ncbi:MAG: hypothetical protein JOZ17_26960 [Acetobacteraceae bacterium]|nr:hypothetical protein [Acetobacteraceae bacterium]